MTADFVRDAAMTAVIFGFFASGWFGWAQEKPPPTWPKWLGIGSGVSMLTAVAGGLLAWRHWTDGTVFDADTSKAFGLVVAIEFGAAGLGALLLAVTRHKDLVPAWVALVVGLHLFPVAVLLHYPLIHLPAVLLTVVALAAVPVARARSLPVSAVTGVGCGAALLVSALISLAGALLLY
ncbi:hypothetical protein AB0M79_33325 [Polymorphospora sp. NPDC051019]|uniref:hypothetical protein n=1 Tax=Polymorphospora sp. NPDC051019 TaxID=3155725 RepID=UPI00343370B8